MIIAILILLSGTIFWVTAIYRLPLKTQKIIVNGKKIFVWVADTEDSREQGLQNIIWLPKNSGMLFVFDQPGKYCFWNKNTLRSLKLIFMNKGKITEEKYLPSIWKGKQTICPRQKADNVIEIIDR